VGCEVAAGRAHLVDPPCNKFPQAHKVVGGKVGWVVLVGWGRCLSYPLSEHHVPGSRTQGVVGACQDLGWGNVLPSWEGEVEYEGGNELGLHGGGG